MKIGLLRFFAFLFLLPGLVGLVASAALSIHYFNTRSHQPEPRYSRTVPRELKGQTVYITAREDQQLDFLRYYGLRSFGIGLGLGLLYLGAMALKLDRRRDSGDVAD